MPEQAGALRQSNKAENERLKHELGIVSSCSESYLRAESTARDAPAKLTGKEETFEEIAAREHSSADDLASKLAAEATQNDLEVEGKSGP